MPFELTKEKRKQKYLILILALVVLAVFFVVGKGLLVKEPSSAEATLPASTFKKVEIDWPVLEDPKLAELEIFEKVVPFEGEIGRENPFVPY